VSDRVTRAEVDALLRAEADRLYGALQAIILTAERHKSAMAGDVPAVRQVVIARAALRAIEAAAGEALRG
jgi:hypothetical protein